MEVKIPHHIVEHVENRGLSGEREEQNDIKMPSNRQASCIIVSVNNSEIISLNPGITVTFIT